MGKPNSDPSKPNALIQELANHPLFQDLKNKLVQIAACDQAELEPQKAELAKLIPQMQEANKNGKAKIRAEIRTLIEKIENPVLEKTAAARNLEPNLEFEKLFQPQGLLNPTEAVIEGDRLHRFVRFCFHKPEKTFEVQFPQLSKTKVIELTQKISQKRYELDPIELVKRTGIDFDLNENIFFLDPKKVESYFAKMEKRKQELRANPNRPNDLGFFDLIQNMENKRNRYLKMNFKNRNGRASLDLYNLNRLRFANYDQNNPNDFASMGKIINKFEYNFSFQLNLALLNEATLNINYQGEGYDLGDDLLAIEICLKRAEQFLEKVKAIKLTDQCKIWFDRKNQPVATLESWYNSQKKINLFAKNIRGLIGISGKELLELFQANFGGVPLTYLFQASKKIGVEKSQDLQYPDKLVLEIDPKKHAKWLERNLPNRD